MSTQATIHALSPNRPASKAARKVLTYKDYAALTPVDNGNYELLNGQISFMPSPTPQHQEVIAELLTQMRNFVKSKDLGKVYTAPLDITFDETNTLQPDLLFISKDRAHIIGAKRIEGAPDLVVEILSEGNAPKEMAYKKYIYETFLVHEYWLINLKKKTITQYCNEDGEFQKAGVFKVDETVKSVVLDGFETKLADLL